MCEPWRLEGSSKPFTVVAFVGWRVKPAERLRPRGLRFES